MSTKSLGGRVSSLGSLRIGLRFGMFDLRVRVVRESEEEDILD